MEIERPLVILRGGGDLATGVAVRLHRCGFDIVVLEIQQPLAVRRRVAFAEAVYTGGIEVGGVRSVFVSDSEKIPQLFSERIVPVLVDPAAKLCAQINATALVDGRMIKTPPETTLDPSLFAIGLGPGFTAGVNCHAVIETNRGHNMGRVIWEGGAEPDTKVPEAVAGFDVDRVLRAPVSGLLDGGKEIGSMIKAGDEIVRVGDVPVEAPFNGALRGLVHDGVRVEAAAKIGDLDPRGEPSYCFSISDKALAVGGGVLEALLSQPHLQRLLSG
ncbi:MAG: selenium-dependent molybdenum cofactor biosynthesis protein YqeB [Chloroflexota bacterium]|nr:selenium-dependent molybdenum cofactor biosynthesis protein YqeB [Chloroflexota bacterium]